MKWLSLLDDEMPDFLILVGYKAASTFFILHQALILEF